VSKMPNMGAFAQLGAFVNDGAGVDHQTTQNTNGKPTRTPSRALR
jgi:hypothetical protein